MTTLPLDADAIPRAQSAFTTAPPTLDELAVRYGTDKRVGVHSYTKWYDALFSSRRWERLTMLEIGVQSGASIRMWADYFPNAKLVGINIDPRCAQFATKRVQIITGSQDNPEIAAFLSKGTAGSTSSSTTAATSANTSAPASTCIFPS